MPYRIPNIAPIDTQPSTVVGVALPFTGAGDAVFNSNFTTRNQIKTNLINLLLTNKGERVMKPTYGANLREFVFEASVTSTYEGLQERIQSEISQHFPQIRIAELIVTPNEDNYSINVNITYAISNFGINDEINLTFQ
jgi:phage baseplate assembly protein W|tara:strand:- start:879 stop:1292 length:414 start_codon:yes stop_codon:yes gene_type:complete